MSANPLWTGEGCPHRVTGDVAAWLFGGRYGSWEGRARPVFDPRRIAEAVAAGRIRPDGRSWPTSAHPPVAPPWFGIGQVPGIEARRQQVTAALAQALVYDLIDRIARTSVDPTFRTVNGRELGAGQIHAHLKAAAVAARGSGRPQPAGTWKGVRVALQGTDRRTSAVLLSVDGVNHVAIPLPGDWTSNPARTLTALTDAVTAARSRAAVLWEAGNALADYLACARGWPTDPPPAAGGFPAPLRIEPDRAALPAPARAMAARTDHDPHVRRGR